MFQINEEQLLIYPTGFAALSNTILRSSSDKMIPIMYTGKNKQGGGKTLTQAQIVYTAVTSSPLSADVTDPTFLNHFAETILPGFCTVVRPVSSTLNIY